MVLLFENREFENELNEMNIQWVRITVPELTPAHRHLRNKINHWWQQKQLRSSNTKIDKSRSFKIENFTWRQLIRNKLLRLYYLIINNYLGGISKLLALEKDYFYANQDVQKIKDHIIRLQPDALISFAPFLLGEETLSRLIRDMGIPACASILSFDNLLRRNRVPVVFDEYFLWNKEMEQQLRRSVPESINRNVKIIGAPQFDFYYDKSYLWSEAQWRNRLGLPDGRPVILFGAGYYKIVPNEHHWLKQLDDAVENQELRGRPVILFRIHPNDPLDRWEPILEQAKHIVFDRPWKTQEAGKATSNITRDDIEKLVSTLHHSLVHVNASSTMTVDGAIFDRPQIGPAYDDQPGGRYDKVVKELYRREHFLPIVQSGGLELANSRDELVALVNAAFAEPERLSSERKDMIKEICTFNDGKSTERLEESFRAYLISKRLI